MTLEIKINESQDKNEIEKVFEQFLYVPDERLKPRIIEELSEYIISKFHNENYKMKIFIAKQDETETGIAMCMDHPTYTSYGRKAGTIGWINAKNFKSCKGIIEECEKFLKKEKLRRIRLNINFPKKLGGLGIQTMGFHHKMIYGVAFNDPNSKIIEYLTNLGYKKESEYICMKVTQSLWKSGRVSDKSIKFRYLTLNEIKEKINDFHDLIKGSFHNFAPDSSGSDRLKEIIATLTLVPKSFYKLKSDIKYKNYSKFPEFQEAWETCDIENVITWMPLAFDRKSEKLVGAIISLPDLYQMWLNHSITRTNVDTVMIDEKYRGKGIFSALNNLGQLTLKINGINYFEGTSIWANNEYAIRSIFPHGETIRKHIVLQKRI